MSCLNYISNSHFTVNKNVLSLIEIINWRKFLFLQYSVKKVPCVTYFVASSIFQWSSSIGTPAPCLINFSNYDVDYLILLLFFALLKHSATQPLLLRKVWWMDIMPTHKIPRIVIQKIYNEAKLKATSPEILRYELLKDF